MLAHYTSAATLIIATATESLFIASKSAEDSEATNSSELERTNLEMAKLAIRRSSKWLDSQACEHDHCTKKKLVLKRLSCLRSRTEFSFGRASSSAGTKF